MLTTYRLRFGNEIVAVVKGKRAMTKEQIKEQARLDAELVLSADRIPRVFSKIHYATIEQVIPVQMVEA